MNMTDMPWFSLTASRPERFHQLAWFLYGCIEREHALNMRACMDWWLRTVAASPGGSMSAAAVSADAEGETP